MQENYTQSASAVLKLAVKAAKSSGHSYIGTEHLLIGLVQEQKGTAGEVLRSYHVEEEKLKAMIERLIAPEGSIAFADEKAWTPRAEDILKDSGSLAEMLGCESDRKSVV